MNKFEVLSALQRAETELEHVAHLLDPDEWAFLERLSHSLTRSNPVFSGTPTDE